MKRYTIKTIATSIYGAESVVEVKMNKNKRRFLVDEDSLVIPLDGDSVSKAMLGALCENAAWREFDKRWHLNVQRPVTANDIVWANEFVAKADEWDWN